jgi:hypothetical protein
MNLEGVVGACFSSALVPETRGQDLLLDAPVLVLVRDTLDLVKEALLALQRNHVAEEVHELLVRHLQLILGIFIARVRQEIHLDVYVYVNVYVYVYVHHMYV